MTDISPLLIDKKSSFATENKQLEMFHDQKFAQSILNVTEVLNLNVPEISFDGIGYASITESDQKNKIQKFYAFNYKKNAKAYFRIKTEENERFCKENPVKDEKIMNFLKNLSSQNTLLDIFDFDIRKHINYLEISMSEEDSGIPIKIDLNPETTTITQATYETLEKRKSIVNKADFDKFKYQLDAYYIIEIETKKTLAETKIKEDNMVRVDYLLIKSSKKFVNIFTRLLNTTLFERKAMENYIIKYIYNLIFLFCNLPNEEMLSTVGRIKVDKNKVLKDIVKNIRKTVYKKKLEYMKKNIPAICNDKKEKYNNVPFHKIVYLDMQFDHFYNEKEFMVKRSKFAIDKTPFGTCVNKSLIINEKDMTAFIQGTKVNMKQLGIEMFRLINEEVEKEKKQKFDDYIFKHISNRVKEYVSFNGFIKIEIIINDDEDVEVVESASLDKKARKSCNKCSYQFMEKMLRMVNYVFSANEGMHHKHLTVNNLSYNFNEKNIVHIFPEEIDASKRNKIRVFDIPFYPKWIEMVSSLILYIYKNFYGLMEDGSLLDNPEHCNRIKQEFFLKFEETTSHIIDNFYKLYEEYNSLPDFKSFCSIISRTSLKGYSKFDNVCQHFANISSEELLKKTSKYFPMFSMMSNEEENSCKPYFDCLLEPYLILCDKKFQDYLEVNSKQEYLKKNSIDYKYFLRQCKEVKLNREFEYNYMFLLNLANVLIFEEMKTLRKHCINYAILKKALANADIREIADKDATIVQETKDEVHQKSAVKEEKKKFMKSLEKIRKVKNCAKILTSNFYDYIVSYLSSPRVVEELDGTYSRVCYYLVNIPAFINNRSEENL